MEKIAQKSAKKRVIWGMPQKQVFFSRWGLPSKARVILHSHVVVNYFSEFSQLLVIKRDGTFANTQENKTFFTLNSCF